MRELLAALTTAFGPPGAEAGVRTVIAEAVRPVVDRVWTDPLGNLLAERQGGAGPHTLLLAHLDEPGMVVTDVDGEGRAWVQALGPVDLAGFRGTRVVAEDGRRGVLTVAPERGREARREVWVDGGPGTSFRPGDVAVWDVAPVFQGGVCIGRALDGRAGCAVLVESLRRLREAVGRLTVAFCVQDHVGGKGAAAAAEAVRPDRMVAVDGAGADAEREGRPSAVRIGCGPSLRVYDDHIATHPSVRRALVAAAEACGLPWQAGVGAPAGPGPGRAHVRAGGIPTACLDVPVRHRLTPAEMVSLDDLEAAVEILVHFLQSQGLAAV